jgi:hypothetical protein
VLIEHADWLTFFFQGKGLEQAILPWMRSFAAFQGKQGQ